MSTREIYLNPAQREIIDIGANFNVIVGGRRLGKSHGMMAPFVLRNFERMPGSSGAFIGSSYKRLLTNTLPGTLNALEQFGYKRGRDWVIGIKPPKGLGFKKPLIEPMSYEHVICFRNGSIAYLISQDMQGTSNSMTLDWLAIDEAKFVDHDKLKNETFPANGGIKSHFGHLSCHHSVMIISDMGVTKKESWFLQYREKSDTELISAIKAIIAEIIHIQHRINESKRTKRSYPKYLDRELKYYYSSLACLRRHAVLYREYSSIENIELLGVDYIKQMERDLPPLTFQTSILCKRITNKVGGFYSSMKESHKYSGSDIDYLQSLEFDDSRIANECSLMDNDVQHNRPICVAFDYNANINWLVAAQPQHTRLNVIKSFYVKYERKLKELVNDFCSYYRYHKNKTVVFYYDSTALGNNYAVDKKDFAYMVKEYFVYNGWSVIMKYIGKPIQHMFKHFIINEMFDGRRNLVPHINKENNEDLILSIESTEVRNGKKDKSGEKLMEKEDDRLEHRTDGSDAFDTLCLGCEEDPYITSIIHTSNWV